MRRKTRARSQPDSLNGRRLWGRGWLLPVPVRPPHPYLYRSCLHEIVAVSGLRPWPGRRAVSAALLALVSPCATSLLAKSPPSPSLPSLPSLSPIATGTLPLTPLTSIPARFRSRDPHLEPRDNRPSTKTDDKASRRRLVYV